MRVHGRHYSLEMQHPGTGEIAVETHDSLPAVVARAAELIQEGYRIGIWSPVSFERHWGHPLRSISVARHPTFSLGG
jgi:hypothetical protein